MSTQNSNFLDSLISVTICLIGVGFYGASILALGAALPLKSPELVVASVVLYLIGKFIVWFGSNI